MKTVTATITILLLAALAIAGQHLRSGTYVVKSDLGAAAQEIQVDGDTPGSFTDPALGETCVEKNGAYVYSAPLVGGEIGKSCMWQFSGGRYQRVETWVLGVEQDDGSVLPLPLGVFVDAGTCKIKGS